MRELIERKKDREIKVRKSVQWLETQKNLTSSTSETLVTPHTRPRHEHSFKDTSVCLFCAFSRDLKLMTFFTVLQHFATANETWMSYSHMGLFSSLFIGLESLHNLYLHITHLPDAMILGLYIIKK